MDEEETAEKVLQDKLNDISDRLLAICGDERHRAKFYLMVVSPQGERGDLQGITQMIFHDMGPSVGEEQGDAILNILMQAVFPWWKERRGL